MLWRAVRKFKVGTVRGGEYGGHVKDGLPISVNKVNDSDIDVSSF